MTSTMGDKMLNGMPGPIFDKDGNPIFGPNGEPLHTEVVNNSDINGDSGGNDGSRSETR